MMERKYEERIAEWDGGIYVVRDYGAPPGKCQFAVRNGNTIKWKLCEEGVLYADIEPLVKLNF